MSEGAGGAGSIELETRKRNVRTLNVRQKERQGCALVLTDGVLRLLQANGAMRMSVVKIGETGFDSAPTSQSG
jgi:hypothetical protein